MDSTKNVLLKFKKHDCSGEKQWKPECSTIDIAILFDRFEITNLTYSPKFESLEMFSSIGGYMGMWLGVSLVTLYDFIGTFIVFVKAWAVKKRRKRVHLRKKDPYYTTAAANSKLYQPQLFHNKIHNCDEAHFWLNCYVNKQNCRIWSEANPQVYVETPLHPEKLTVWCALWAGGILLQKR
ncbi:uncharacterized protein TNCV_4309301 [Trichonephila clavipes]|nr:uncharacterized protein TNCV_4309301 [Trichonephila clavipes]